ncbi:MAG TPA: hypothetical protein VMU51_01010 [Mycobacteriales bacterium]|nr:hypothetical protein [Mycobacteriales bacterium]
MTAPEDHRTERRAAFHALLLRLAGKAPDDLITQSRGWVAEGREGEAARAVTFAVLAQGIPLVDVDIALLGELLEADGADSSALTQVQLAQFDPAPPFGFGPTPPDVEPPARPDDAPTDEIDRAAVAAIAEETGVHGLWRAWRYPADESPWPPPRRIYLVEADEDVDLVDMTARLGGRLTAAGESDPQVEAYPVGAELPTYQRLARAYAGLIWASTPSPEIKVAAVFDEVDAESGPRFTAEHQRIEDEAEAGRMLAYLNAGEPLLVTTAQMDDVVDRSRRNVVPMNFRTDGTWIWTDTTTYYLQRHGLAPDIALVDHIRDASYEMPALDGVAIHRAMAVLQEPADEEPVWTYDGSAGEADDF